MTTEELHKILDDENKTISLEEYQNVLYQLKNDTIYFATQVKTKQHYYNGETNAFQIALDLSEHIEPLQNQKAIESLKRCEYFIGNLLAGNYDRTLEIICEYIDGKIKELEASSECDF